MKTCLFIDDDPDDHEIFELAFKEVSGAFNLVACTSSSEALKYISNENFSADYIFVDLNMPGLNGIDIITIIRKIPRFDLTNVYIYSTSSHPEDRQLSNQYGIKGFITKPTKYADVVKVLRSLLL